MPQVILEFSTQELANMFWGWYLDDGHAIFRDILVDQGVTKGSKWCHIKEQTSTKTIIGHTIIDK